MQEPMLLLHLLAMTIWPPRREYTVRRLVMGDRVRELYEFTDGRLTRLQLIGVGGEPDVAQLFRYGSKGELDHIEHTIIRRGVEGGGGRKHSFQWRGGRIIESHDTGIHCRYEYSYGVREIVVTAHDTREANATHVIEFQLDEKRQPTKSIERRGARILATSTFAWDDQARLQRFVRQAPPDIVLADVELGWLNGRPCTVTYSSGVTYKFD